MSLEIRPTPLRATYRLQFNRSFTLAQARACVPYLCALGISHVYASPLLRARAGSMHGYDVTDPTLINPEIGDARDLEALVQTLREHGMGLVLDIVPNHMAVGDRENTWWWDVLRRGRQSPFATFFDVDWDSPDPDLHGRVLVPILGESLDAILDRGEVTFDPSGSEPCLRYFDHILPVDPASMTDASGDLPPLDVETWNTPARLRQLLDRQHYLLAHWRDGDRRLNYRRFFNITHLAGVRVEVPEVFEATHWLVLDWHRRGWIDGFRVDHPDGLRDPEEYFGRLEKAAPGAWITVEKILEPGEELRATWPVAGTTGYDYLNRAGGLFIDPSGEKQLTAFYQEFTGETVDAKTSVCGAKREVLECLLVAEINRLLPFLGRLAARDPATQGIEPSILKEGLIELIACLPVYRTYIQAEAGMVSEEDRARIREACDIARDRTPNATPVLDLLERILLRPDADSDAIEWIMRFQQLTGPAMAKGVEDRAFYRLNRLVALNEVGGSLESFGGAVEEFHEDCRRQQKAWPRRMLASSTHDTKRSEDVRARLGLLSESPDSWTTAVRRWSVMNESHRTGSFPDRNAEYLFYQSLVGAWPISGERLTAYMEKAVHEAAQHTTWTEPVAEYEAALRRFVEGALQSAPFMAEVEAFVGKLLEPGYRASLAQTLLKLTAPGIPDIYQGTELWDLSLVDPDNRRPVDFERRREILDAVQEADVDAVWVHWAEGWPKAWLISRTLAFRKRRPAAFCMDASYEALPVEGPRARHGIAYLRGGCAACIAPRFTLTLGATWSGTRVQLPLGTWRNELTDETVEGGSVSLDSLLQRFPVALLSLGTDA